MEYKVLSKFTCCGNTMVTVIMNKAACVMMECEYNRMMRRKQWKR